MDIRRFVNREIRVVTAARGGDGPYGWMHDGYGLEVFGIEVSMFSSIKVAKSERNKLRKAAISRITKEIVG